MQRRFRQVCTVVKEHSVVSYAKIATVGGFRNVDHIVVKATAPNDMPLPEKYIHELLKLFSISGQSSFRAFSLSFTRRFGRTHCWRVALKCLLLLHRLLRSVPPNSPFRSELLWTRTNGLISLHPCRFVDDSSFSSREYTLFVRSYAHLLDEALNCSDFSCEEKQSTLLEEEEEEEGKQRSLAEKMKEVGRMLEILPQLQSLMDRAMECRPVGLAARSFVVKSAMKHIIRDSFGCYDVFRREIVVVLDNLFQMPYGSCKTAFGIYKKAAVQSNHLCEFYEWCKAMGLCGRYEYPFIERIPLLQIQALERFLNGMWQFTDDSSSGSSPLPLSSLESLSSSNEDDREAVVDGRTGESSENKSLGRKFYVEEEEEPLTQLEEESDQNVSWERLLEESVNMSPAHQHIFFGTSSNDYGHGYGYGNHMIHGYGNQMDPSSSTSIIQVYNPKAANPFDQPWMTQDHQRSLPLNYSGYSGATYYNFYSSSN
ncbi:AP180 N-terminal domain containing protein [Trema orientale]|uniref:AP180 N-terminal domain containing protein n=1 Tax=Trema orientale TaxID=63057 RepID=A0A2P5BXZ9_TREOI|nr:AP180 N-terminal domain containing protein [Trema orientale]